MDLMGAIGILLGVFLIIYLVIKDMHIIIAAPLATIAVVLLNNMDMFNSMLGQDSTSYMSGLSSYILNFFIIFLLGSILAKLMEESGATVSIAEYILQKIGYDNPYRVLVAIFLVGVILTYGGISIFVVMFAVIPLAKTLFKKMDLSWKLIQIPIWLGIGTITMTILPGTPVIQNVIPIQYLNTSLTAAAIPSLLGSLGAVVFGLYYMRRQLNKSIAAGETFSTYSSGPAVEENQTNLPQFFSSILPLLSLIIIAVLGSIFGNEFIKRNIIYIALVVAIILCLILFRKHFKNAVATLSIGATSSVAPIFATASAVAFGTVVMAAPSFSIFSDLILSIPGSPYISLTVLTSAMSAITGSSSGALGIVMPNFAQNYVDAGLHPEMIHRVATVASNITTVVPQGGAFITFLTLTGLNYKNGFKETFTVVFGSCLIAVIIIIATGALMY